jgi:nucleotide-binding universal stress UspA family protein
LSTLRLALKIMSSKGIAMIKTILVPTSGSDSDASVFATALLLARPFAAHLQFLHVHLGPATAALYTPHVEFCRGPAVATALAELGEQQDALSRSALKHFEGFCASNGIVIRNTPGRLDVVSASWAEETDEPLRRLISHARHNDVVVLGRPRNRDSMPRGLIEEVLMHAGRPVLIAAESGPGSVTGTIAVGWKETPEAARAVTAALPLLKAAGRVTLLAVTEPGSASRQELDDLARQLVWHGITAEVDVVGESSQTTASARLAAAAAKVHADLLVVGAYGHGPLRELVFGGVTRALIEDAALPVFLLH